MDETDTSCEWQMSVCCDSTTGSELVFQTAALDTPPPPSAVAAAAAVTVSDDDGTDDGTDDDDDADDAEDDKRAQLSGREYRLAVLRNAQQAARETVAREGWPKSWSRQPDLSDDGLGAVGGVGHVSVDAVRRDSGVPPGVNGNDCGLMEEEEGDGEEEEEEAAAAVAVSLQPYRKRQQDGWWDVEEEEEEESTPVPPQPTKIRDRPGW